jgi:hypothetical protein
MLVPHPLVSPAGVSVESGPWGSYLGSCWNNRRKKKSADLGIKECSNFGTSGAKPACYHHIAAGLSKYAAPFLFATPAVGALTLGESILQVLFAEAQQHCPYADTPHAPP